MTWHRTKLTSEQVTEGLVQQFSNDFSAVFKAANAPRMMAFFQRECPDGGLDL